MTRSQMSAAVSDRYCEGNGDPCDRRRREPQPLSRAWRASLLPGGDCHEEIGFPLVTHTFVFISSEYSEDDTLRSRGLLYQRLEAWGDGLPATLTLCPLLSSHSGPVLPMLPFPPEPSTPQPSVQALPCLSLLSLFPPAWRPCLCCLTCIQPYSRLSACGLHLDLVYKSDTC